MSPPHRACFNLHHNHGTSAVRSSRSPFKNIIILLKKVSYHTCTGLGAGHCPTMLGNASVASENRYLDFDRKSAMCSLLGHEKVEMYIRKKTS